jgi:hypothetical protein
MIGVLFVVDTEEFLIFVSGKRDVACEGHPR